MSSKPRYEQPVLIEFGSNLEAKGVCQLGSVHLSGQCNPVGYSGRRCSIGGDVGTNSCGSGISGNTYYCHYGQSTRFYNCTGGGGVFYGQCVTGGTAQRCLSTGNSPTTTTASLFSLGKSPTQ